MSRPSVGVLGDDGIRKAVAAAGGDPIVDVPSAVAASRPEVVVTVGERALFGAVAAGVDCPVLPVDGGAGVRSVPRDAVSDALAAVFAGRYETATLPVVTARSPLGETRALCEVMLVAAEPARISEYTVESGGDPVATFRADGVVVATPTGSRGYARRAGGPVLAPETDALAVVPVAPFATDEDAWVVPATDVTVRVERDETPVELLADDRTVGAIASGESVHASRAGSLSVAVVDASRGRFE